MKQFRSLTCLHSLALIISHSSTNFEYSPRHTQATFLTHKCPHCCFSKPPCSYHKTQPIPCTARSCTGLSNTAPHFQYFIPAAYRTTCTGVDVSQVQTVKYLNNKNYSILILTHNSGRVKQICVFNTVKLGTSASSP